MNFGQLIDRTYHHLPDSTRTNVPPGAVHDWLNDAHVDVAVRLRLLQKETSSTTDGTNTIALPSDFVEAISLRIGTVDYVPVDDDAWNSFSDDATTPSEPYFFRVFGTNLELYPTPTNGSTYKLRHYYYPAAMDTPEDVPGIPVEQHTRLVDYASAEGLYLLNETAEADRYMARYEDGLPPRETSRSRRDPGPMVLTPYLSPFEEDLEWHA